MVAVAFPNVKFQRSSSLGPVQNRNVNRLRGGAAMTEQNGVDYWQGKYVTTPLNEQQRGQVRAFLMAHGGGKSSVLLGDPLRCLPIAYTSFDGLERAVGGAFDGVGDLQTITDLMNVTVDNLPGNFQVSAGDIVGAEEGGKYSLHMVTADAIGDASGTIDLQIEPPLPLARTTAAKVRFEKPVGEFIIEANSASEQPFATQTVISFSAVSRLT